MIPQQTTPVHGDHHNNPMHTEYILKGLKELFDEAHSGDYIAAINTFTRQRIERATREERRNMYNILKLMEVLPLLEIHFKKIYRIDE